MSRRVAPIRARWQPDVHHVGDASVSCAACSAKSESWDVLRDLSPGAARECPSR